MARSDVEHYALLNRWPLIMQDNPWHFNQISGVGAPLSHDGDEVYIQSERDDIADALNQACELAIEELGFFPRPFWTTEVIPLGNRNPYELQTLRTRYGYLEEFTQRTKTLIQTDVAVVYSDEDGDGVDETATITIVTGIDADEVRAYFRVVDGAIEAGSDDWEIEPLRVTAAAGTVTLVGPRWLFVCPIDIWAHEYVDPNYTEKYYGTTDDPLDFVVAVDLYRVYGATAYAVGVRSDPLYDDCTGLDGNNVSYGVARIVNAKLGIFQVRLECPTGCYAYPESVQVHYKSGFPLRNNAMDRRLEVNLIRLANTRMPWQPDSFHESPTLSRWQYDRKPVTSTNEFTGLASTPWGGLMTGEIVAWSNLRGLALQRAGKITAR